MALLPRRKVRLLFPAILLCLAFPFAVHFVEQYRYNDLKSRLQEKIYITHQVFSPFDIKQIPSSIIDVLAHEAIRKDKESPQENKIDWNRFAYVNYVDDIDYLCNSIVIFKTLKRRFGSKAKMVLLLSEAVFKSAHSAAELTFLNNQLHEAKQFLGEKELDIKLVTIPKNEAETPESNEKRGFLNAFKENLSGGGSSNDDDTPAADNAPVPNPPVAGNIPVDNAPIPNAQPATASAPDSNGSTSENIQVVNTNGETSSNNEKATENKSDAANSFDYVSALTKYSMFNAINYDRIIYIDNDARLTHNLDELFFLPSYIEFAAPLQFWKIPVESYTDSIRLMQKDGEDIDISHHLNMLTGNILNQKEYYNFLPKLPPSLFFEDKSIIQRVMKSASDAISFLDFDELGITNSVQFQTSLMVLKPNSEVFKNIQDNILPSLKGSSQETNGDSAIINKNFFNLRSMLFNQYNDYKNKSEDFRPKIMILPYKRYGLLSKLIRDEAYYPMLINDIIGYHNINAYRRHEKELDILDVLSACKYLHFNEDLYDKPWRYKSINDIQCSMSGSSLSQKACTLWRRQYDMFLSDRQMCLIAEEKPPIANKTPN
ncbi:hypothetical protein TPHA_0G01070 [Tetrapisispora phaffii CBS 4417]|uniref:Glucose N-acetyltransferase 1 n=1 Tax=Tetrapisispora phaffii (strain ATCC 24235 / CBS 4417 / NBRC 1672 / NRRL Y-8282 / UCD 70-5) TaxID=1071381 RepID=G8BVL6_TETPH|nr:hypothetical protein TPHA_0G01070 [Tetrapisispora phaffii CBS 4417]CCE63944.1 hypothetical protein TPHA_0G01070 [Tetrapisispora phaffii CBS 4417]